MINNCNGITRSKCFDGKRHDFIKVGWCELRPKWYAKWCNRCGSILYQYQQKKTFADVINGFIIPDCIISTNFGEEIKNGKKAVGNS